MKNILQTLRLALSGYDWREEAVKMIAENRMAIAAIRNLLIRKGTFKEEEYSELLNKMEKGMIKEWQDYEKKL